MLVECSDNVVVAIEPIRKGEAVTYICQGAVRSFQALEDVTIYHKLACRDIAGGEAVVKYGEHIGIAGRNILTGEHVHVHNVVSHRENLD